MLFSSLYSLSNESIMHLASVDIATPNDFDVAAQMLPNEQRRWRDFSYGSEMGYMV